MSDTEELERRHVTRKSALGVLQEMQLIADEEYQGDLQSNILEIFLEINDDDKKTYLRRAAIMYWERMVDDSMFQLKTGFIINEDRDKLLEEEDTWDQGEDITEEKILATTVPSQPSSFDTDEISTNPTRPTRTESQKFKESLTRISLGVTTIIMLCFILITIALNTGRFELLFKFIDKYLGIVS